LEESRPATRLDPIAPEEAFAMNREQALVETFVELVDSLVEDYDVVEFLEGLATHCVELLDVSEAGIMLVDPDGKLRYVASSSERMRLVELLELQLEEGPCFDAYRQRDSVVSHSIDDAADRWPTFAAHVRDAGFSSVAAVPMRLRSRVIGALNLFSVETGEIAADDLRVGQAMADVATIGILHHRAMHDAHSLVGQLEGALESRVVIEQAKGVVAARGVVGVDDAFGQIRSFAREHNRLLSDVAREIVSGSIDVAELLGRGGSESSHP
jgi:transcriptional regulator with GAF, ATPase, and Fis domain